MAKSISHQIIQHQENNYNRITISQEEKIADLLQFQLIFLLKMISRKEYNEICDRFYLS